MILSVKYIITQFHNLNYTSFLMTAILKGHYHLLFISTCRAFQALNKKHVISDQRQNMDPQLVCKKSLTLPYQQSFRIDDLLTPKAIEQQPDHFSHHHHHTSLQPPPSGLGVGVACLEKTFPEEQKSSGMENTMMCQAAAMVIYFFQRCHF